MSKKIPPPKSHRVRGLNLEELSREMQQLVNRLADIVRSDNELDLQIRDGYLNVYYLGGSLWKVTGLRSKQVRFEFDSKYFSRKDKSERDKNWLPKPTDGTEAWLESLPKQKQTMQEWFKENEKAEREMQHNLSVNHRKVRITDLILIDIEYAAWLHGDKDHKGAKDSRRLCRFDMVAVERKTIRKGEPLKLLLIEFKQGNGAIAGKSGMESHIEDFNQFLDSNENFLARKAFNNSMANIIREKAKLKLLLNALTETDLGSFEIIPCIMLHDCDKRAQVEQMAKKLMRTCQILEYKECL